MKRGVIVFGLTFACPVAWAWNDLGHLAIAARARTQLTGRSLKEAERLLRAAGADSFVLCSTFADDTKNRHTSPLHYINLRFEPSQPSWDGKVMGSPNVVTAISNLAKRVGDRKTSDKARGEALCLLIHFVADVHQPLHAVARVSKRFPEGDKGGNQLRIVRSKLLSPPPKNLHALWDMGGGLFAAKVPGDLRAKERLALELAARLARGPVPHDKVQIDDPMMWALESFALAKHKAYSLPSQAVLTPSYLQMCRDVSAAQSALAARRLAHLVNRALGHCQVRYPYPVSGQRRRGIA